MVDFFYLQNCILFCIRCIGAIEVLVSKVYITFKGIYTARYLQLCSLGIIERIITGTQVLILYFEQCI